MVLPVEHLNVAAVYNKLLDILNLMMMFNNEEKDSLIETIQFYLFTNEEEHVQTFLNNFINFVEEESNFWNGLED